MKYINKGGEPLELHQWHDSQPVVDGKRINCKYRHMPTDVKKIVKEKLLNEQGYLCCYTGRVIDEASSHIEHIRPQTLCIGEFDEEDIAYANLLAAFPGGSLRAPYGAHAKDGWYDSTNFVSPLQPNCETKFRFTQFGQISAVNTGDNAATETIQHLDLNHAELTDLRRQAIQRTLIDLKPSVKQLERIQRHYCERLANDRFNSFCFVIQQVAQIILAKSKRQARAKKHMRNATRRYEG